MIPFIDLLMVTISFLLITAVWSHMSRINADAQVPGPPRPDQELVGCDFAARCDRAETICHVQSPRATPVADEHAAACHFADTDEKHRLAQGAIL